MSTPTNAVATRKDVLAFLQNDNVKKQVALALPRHMNADRMLRVMLTTVNAAGYVGEKLRACTPESLIASLMKCSQYGLEPDGRHAHLIPYGKECQLIFDYKGLVALVRRSGEVKTIHADVVYEGDEFSYCYGTGAHLRHKPTLEPGKRGEAIAAYSFVVSATGEESFEVLSIDDIEAVRDSSQGYQYAKQNKKQTPWDTYFAEMAKKTAFRRHTKWLPLSFELKEAVNADDDTSEENRFKNAKSVATSGIFGASETPALTEGDSDQGEPETAPEATKTEPPKPRAAKTETKTTSSPKGEGRGEGADNQESASAPTSAPASGKTSLANDKTILADWMEKNAVSWSDLQPIVSREIGNWADSIGEFSELNPAQAKAIFSARTGIAAELGKPML